MTSSSSGSFTIFKFIKNSSNSSLFIFISTAFNPNAVASLSGSDSDGADLVTEKPGGALQGEPGDNKVW